MIVTYHFLNAPKGSQVIADTVTARAAIVRLVKAINGLPRGDGAVLPCPMDDRRATLRFVRTGGKAVSVTVDSGCDIVVVQGYPALAGNPALWTLLYAVASPGICSDMTKCP